MLFSGPGVTPALKGLLTNRTAVEAGQCWIPPAGWYVIRVGRYSAWQQLDPISQIWRDVGGSDGNASLHYVYTDGVNYRVANQSGCTVGALLTNAGTGYTSAPTVTTTAGGGKWRAIMGSVISTTITVTNGGSGYAYPPLVQIGPPAPGGLQATAKCTLSAGVVSTITVVDQGAGYSSPPIVSFTNDPREGLNGVSTGSGAAAVTSLTGSGTVNAIVCLDHGTPLTTLPTFVFAGGGGSSVAATVIMNWSITAYAAGTAGAGLAGTVARITGEDAFPTTAQAYLNPGYQNGLVKTRDANILAPISGAGITATGQIIYDAGTYTSVPTPLVIPTASIVTTAPVVTFTMGGQDDVCDWNPT